LRPVAGPDSQARPLLLPQLRTSTPKPVSVVGRLALRWRLWQNITSDQWVLNVTPRQFVFSHEQRLFVEAELQELLLERAIELVGTGQRPAGLRLVSPVFCVPKSSGSWRLVHDLRLLNSQLHAPKFKLEGLDKAAVLLQPNCWMVKLDFRRGYYHVDVDLGSRDWLGFQIGENLYRWNVLPFGISMAPYTFTRVVGVVVRHLRRLGVRIMAYLDDFLLVAATREEVIAARDRVLALLDDLGWVIALDKSVLEPHQSLDFLGLSINSQTMEFSIPGTKLVKLLAVVDSVLQGNSLSAWQLASVAGKLVSIMRAWPAVRVFCTELYDALSAALSASRSWTQKIGLSQHARQDLIWIRLNMAKLHGAPIQYPSAVLLLTTDASAVGWAGFVVINGVRRVASGVFPPDMSDCPIHELEMRAVWFALQALRTFVQNRFVQVVTDNSIVRAHLHRPGGRSVQTARIGKEIFALCALFNVRLVGAAWIHSHCNPIADYYSRHELDVDDYRLNPRVFLEIARRFGPLEVDLMANEYNAQLDRFVSWHEEAKSWRVNAFTLSWRGLRGFCHPPLTLIPRVLHHARECRACVVMVLPDWPAPWLPLLLSMETARWQLPGKPSVLFEPGRSGKVRPWKNQHWKFMAVVVDAQR